MNAHRAIEVRAEMDGGTTMLIARCRDCEARATLRLPDERMIVIQWLSWVPFDTECGYPGEVTGPKILGRKSVRPQP